LPHDFAAMSASSRVLMLSRTLLAMAEIAELNDAPDFLEREQFRVTCMTCRKSFCSADSNVAQIKSSHRRELASAPPCSWCVSQVKLNCFASLKF